MRGKALVCAVLVAVLAGCVPPPAPLPVTPPPVAAKGPAEAPAEPSIETPDDAFRYQPPLVAETGSWGPPPVVEVKGPAGMRALLVERHDVPAVSARVAVLSRERVPAPGLDRLALEVTLAAPTKGGPSLVDALAALGATHRVLSGWDDMAIEITAAAPAMEEALRATMRSLAHVETGPPWKGWDTLRTPFVESLRRAVARPETPRARLVRAFYDLLPANHRYREPFPTPADIERIDLGSVVKRRALLFTPDRVRVAAVGDMTPEALRAVLEAGAAGWKAGSAKAGSAPPPPARGVMLREEEGATRVELGIVLPVRPEDPPAMLWPFLHDALRRAVFDWMKKDIPEGWDNGVVGLFDLRDLPGIYVAVSLRPADVTKATRGILDAIGKVAGGEIAEEALASSRRANLRFLEGVWASNADALRGIGWTTLMDLPADHASRLYAAQAQAESAQVRAAAARLDRKAARVVALGAVAAAEADLKQLGLGPVTLERPRKPVTPVTPAAKKK